MSESWRFPYYLEEDQKETTFLGRVAEESGLAQYCLRPIKYRGGGRGRHLIPKSSVGFTKTSIKSMKREQHDTDASSGFWRCMTGNLEMRICSVLICTLYGAKF